MDGYEKKKVLNICSFGKMSLSKDIDISIC